MEQDYTEFGEGTNLEPALAFEVREQYLKPSQRDYRSKIFDLGYFLVILSIGLIIIYLGDGSLSVAAGIILFNGGVAPFLLFIWALLTGPTLFKRRNIFKSLLSVLLMISGIVVLSIYATSADILYHLATSLLSISLLFFVGKALILIEDSEAYANSLLMELKSTRSSLSHGLAMGYFYNFLVPVCENINKVNTTVEVELERGKMEKATLGHGYFFVIIPTSLPEEKIKEAVSQGLKDKLFFSCKIMNAQQHRPMFFNLSQWDTESKTCDGLFDIPTTIGTLFSYERIEAPKEYSIEQEITKFQNILVYLIAKHPHIAEMIRIISVPWPLDPNIINAAIQDALTINPPEFAPGLTLSPILPHQDWLSTVEKVIDKNDDEE